MGRSAPTPDGVPFTWLYTPWPETPVCRTTDFGVIHHGHDADALDRPAILLREIIDDSVPMYPVWWQDEIFSRYLAAVAELGPVIPLGRLGLYKYTTMDSTLAMTQRLVRLLDRYLEGAPRPGEDPPRGARRLGKLAESSRGVPDPVSPPSAAGRPPRLDRRESCGGAHPQPPRCVSGTAVRILLGSPESNEIEP